MSRVPRKIICTIFRGVAFYIVYFVPEKKNCASIPAIGGKMKVQARRMSVNLQPRIPTSIGSLLTAHKDHPVRNATIVPAPAPDFRSAAAIGRLTYRRPDYCKDLEIAPPFREKSRMCRHPRSGLHLFPLRYDLNQMSVVYNVGRCSRENRQILKPDTF